MSEPSPPPRRSSDFWFDALSPMGRRLVVLAVVGIAILLVVLLVTKNHSGTATASTDNAFIAVSGPPGETFTGSIGGIGLTHSVSGTVPATFDLGPGSVFSAVIQKSSADSSELKVILACPHSPDKSASTTAQYGIASVSGRC